MTTPPRTRPSVVTPPPRGQGGFTLVELMVTVVIASFAMAAALTLGYSMMASYQNHRQMLLVERAARGSMDRISRAIRSASPGVPNGKIEDINACESFGPFQVTNSTSGPDRLTVIHASGGVVTSLRAPYTASSNALTVLDGTGFRPGDYAVVTDTNTGALVRIVGVQQSGSNWTLSTDVPQVVCPTPVFPVNYSAGALVIRAQDSSYFVKTIAGIPVLMMDPDGDGPLEAEPLAEGIEDMQVAVGVDTNGDGTLTDTGSTGDEWFYNAVGDLDPPPVATKVPRALRITLVARSTQPEMASPTSIRPAVEDHAGASQTDAFRRRLLSATIEIRNLKGSP